MRFTVRLLLELPQFLNENAGATGLTTFAVPLREVLKSGGQLRIVRRRPVTGRGKLFQQALLGRHSGHSSEKMSITKADVS